MPVRHPKKHILRFSPTAWAKLLYFRDMSNDEIGGFGITLSNDLLYVQDFVTVKQRVTCVSVNFDDESVSTFFEDQVDLGRKPEQFGRLWLHTHPGDSPEPSGTDEDTFERVFGKCQWSLMCIVAENGSTYARLSFNNEPSGQILIPVTVDYSHAFGATDYSTWDAEYDANITAEHNSFFGAGEIDEDELTSRLSDSLLDQLEEMDYEERHMFLDELASNPELWDEDGEVMVA